MADITRQQAIRVIGLYLVIILALVRFLVYPLHTAVAGKKAGLAEQYESYSLKCRLLERQEAEHGGKAIAVDKTALSLRVYEKGVGYFDIQADIIDGIRKFTEKKGLIMVNYELPEPVLGKNVSEVPVVLKLQGKMLDFIETLKIIENGKRFLRIKAIDINKSGNDFSYSLTITALRVEK